MMIKMESFVNKYKYRLIRLINAFNQQTLAFVQQV